MAGAGGISRSVSRPFQISRRVYRSPSQTTGADEPAGGAGLGARTGRTAIKVRLTDKALDVLPIRPLSTALEQRVNHALTEDQQALLAQLLWKVLSGNQNQWKPFAPVFAGGGAARNRAAITTATDRELGFPEM